MRTKDQEKSDSLAKQGRELRDRMEQVCSLASDLLQAISRETDWTWANSDSLLAPLRDSKTKVETLKRTDAFWRDWTLQGKEWSRMCKNNYSQFAIDASLEAGCGPMDEALVELQLQVDMLNCMHNARPKASKK